MRKPFELGGQSIAPGTRRVVNLPLGMMSDHTPVTLSVLVIHGRNDGPTLFVSAAVHGDEVLGVEIVRRLSRLPAVRRSAGTLLLVPVVNSFGFIGHSRYLPDRRDLNRSFPGSASGSLAARLANLFLEEVVCRSDYGIDLHTAAIHRTNLPQIRVDLRQGTARRLALAFSPPVIVNSALRHGSLRQAAQEHDVPVIVFEAGEALRFDELAVRVGVTGTLSVLEDLGMIRRSRRPRRKTATAVAQKSVWVRATESGVLRATRAVGDSVREGDRIGVVADPFGERETEIHATEAGLIIGRTNLPVINQGDALFHIALIPQDAGSGAQIDALAAEYDGDPLFDEDEIA